MWKIGLGSFNFVWGPYVGDPKPLEVVCEYAKKLKFDGIGLLGQGPHYHPGLYVTKEDRKNLRSLITDNYGLEIVDLGGFSFEGTSMTSNFPQLRKLHEKYFETFLEAAYDIDTKKLLFHTGWSTGWSGVSETSGVSHDVAFQRISDAVKRYAKKAENVDVTIVWEFEPWFQLNRIRSDVLRLLKEVNSDYFKALVDTSHAHCCALGLLQPLDELEVIDDTPLNKICAKVIRLLKGFIGHMHLADSNNAISAMGTSEKVPMGKGVIDFEEVMRALVEVGYNDDWLVLDICASPHAWEETEPSKKFIDELVMKF